ncbi:MAG TPA: hypothetical protein VNO18_12455 [Xanthobacteraceae bacterium]|nr:hypothetical protein [Xanthobacteraceae bacterium]
MSKQGTKAFLLAGVALTALTMSDPAKSGILDPAPAYPVRSGNLPPVYDWTGFVGENIFRVGLNYRLGGW